MKRLSIILLVLVVAACTPSEAPEAASTTGPPTSDGSAAPGAIDPEERAPATAWEQVLAGVADPMPLQSAVDAFSVAFRPIDGATPTDLEPGFSGSGSGPLRWLLGHWDELSPAQQGQVEEVLASWEAGPSAAGTAVLASMSPTGGRVAYAAEAPQALVDDMVVNIETLLGRSLTIPVYPFGASPTPVPGAHLPFGRAR